MLRSPRAPDRWRNLPHRLALQIVLTVTDLAEKATTVRRRTGRRRGGDDGVETVEIAIGIALGVALALLVWAAYKAIAQKYLDQLP
ncbi:MULTISPECIES: hypothetical protein [unclassified Crossiella]|uniref:hypothetical protein n=1 Tax=unclassified Crossiella TaxID=2620835 RepID=UPI001FFFE6D2|nr:MULTISPECIES: hypothetical protein [unclassified Crossiella]MCK2241864.1 hypothetical protein [Crossiella sp. S99.2]MCK2255767.1 hypothetical protein [Crossiella sp. S99.1]